MGRIKVTKIIGKKKEDISRNRSVIIWRRRKQG